ncbi:hypothetical protein [Corynebacterium lizhenjunii]|uniref:hypothetical protein n=1 Tax=Corynebacterium lizhenjunii TaxID=2709394 RepID=UPI0013ED2057|nr:hypothetical protein [Corynebacterium lizhenjunii]
MSAVYIIPGSGFGATRSIALHNLQGSPLARLSGTQDYPVTLHADPAVAGLRVRLDGTPLAIMPAADCTEYPELQWLLDQGLTPQVTARISANGLASTAHLRLPRPGLCIPANNPPTQPYVLLPPGLYGHGAVLTQLPDALGVHPRSRVHVLLKLSTSPAGVEVHLGSHHVGTLAEDDAARLAPTIAQHEQRGVMVIARGYLAPRGDESTLTLYAAAKDFDAADVTHAAPMRGEASSFETTTFLAQTPQQPGPLNATGEFPAVQPPGYPTAQPAGYPGADTAHSTKPGGGASRWGTWALLALVLVAAAAVLISLAFYVF